MGFWAALILGVLIGWLIEWVIDWIYWRRKHQELYQTIQTLEQSQERLQQENRALRDQLASIRDCDQVRADLLQTTTLLEQRDAEIATLQAQLVSRKEASPSRTATFAPIAATALTKRDPLIDILGIGPVYERRLFNAGVLTFAQLAALSPEQIIEIIRPESWQTIDAAAWIAEARQRADEQLGSGDGGKA